MKYYTKETYVSKDGCLSKIKIECVYITEKSNQSVKRAYVKRMQFESEFGALMRKYNMNLELPF